MSFWNWLFGETQPAGTIPTLIGSPQDEATSITAVEVTRTEMLTVIPWVGIAVSPSDTNEIG
jgi:hypothetical protein